MWDRDMKKTGQNIVRKGKSTGYMYLPGSR